MIYKQLGRTDLNVSLLCLGSMTWGTQNTAAEGHAQIDMALDHGINFIDTAEMYPTKPLSHFEPMLREVFSRNPFDPAVIKPETAA